MAKSQNRCTSYRQSQMGIGPLYVCIGIGRNGLFVVGSRRDLTVGIRPFDHLTRLLMTFFADL